MPLVSVIFVIALFLLVVAFVIARSRSALTSRDVFDKVYKILNDEESQNAACPELKELLKVNDLSRSVSKLYGLIPKDPIRANGPIGELAYISMLINDQGAGFIGHRLGSLKGLDAFEIVSTDFRDWRVLWLDMYWQTKDVLAPSGLRLPKPNEPWPDGGAPVLSATNRFLANFPHNYWPDIMSATKTLIGIPCVKTALKSLDTSGIVRPSKHAELLQKVVVMMRAEGLGEDS